MRPPTPRTATGPRRLALAALTALLGAACSAPAPEGDREPGGERRPDTLSPPARHETPPGGEATPGGAPAAIRPTADTGRAALLARADEAVAAIARRDWRALAGLTHPERGARFAPYGYVEPAGECTVTLGRDELRALGDDDTVRCWGHFDGSGEPIRLPFADYHERFVHDADYRAARRGAPNERIGQGNTLDNALEAFGPGAAYVEYHVPGSERYGGMDWKSLRLVFVPSPDGWALVGIVHDQWTI